MKEQIEQSCYNCESTYMLLFDPAEVAEEQPTVCPFCGSPLEEETDDEVLDDDGR